LLFADQHAKTCAQSLTDPLLIENSKGKGGRKTNVTDTATTKEGHRWCSQPAEIHDPVEGCLDVYHIASLHEALVLSL
jgi:hypothetical protein